MNEPDPMLTDQDLHAFVDGELDPARLPAVLAGLQARPADAQRVAAWQAQRHELRRLARATDVGETPAALSGIVVEAAGRERRRARWQQAAAALVLLAAGLGAGRWWGLADAGSRGTLAASPAFVGEARTAHAVFTPEKRHPVEVAASEEAHLVQWLGRRLGTTLKAPQLNDRGYRLLGGRLLAGEGAPRAQFMYENTRGQRLTLYVAAFRPGQAPGETAFRSVRDGANESFYWVEGSFGYALSAELPPGELQGIAREVYQQLAR